MSGNESQKKFVVELRRITEDGSLKDDEPYSWRGDLISQTKYNAKSNLF